MGYDLVISEEDYGDSGVQLSEEVERYLDKMHGEVSRTFDAALQKLSGTVKSQVQTGYLMCRIPDTIEDSNQLSGEEKYSLLNQYREVLKDPDQRNVGEFVRNVFDDLGKTEIGEFGAQTDNLDSVKVGAIGDHTYGSEKDASYWDLVKNTHAVTHAFQRFDSEIKEYMRDAVDEMSYGMAQYSKDAYENGDSGIRIKDFDELEQYCHYVAGTVGDLLTNEFSEHEDMPEDIENYSEGFGQFLQTVNIIKDPLEDFEKESAIFIPEEALPTDLRHKDLQEALKNQDSKVLNEPIQELTHRADKKSESAKKYIEQIEKDSEIRGYVEVPFLLAKATLREAHKNPEKAIEGDLSIEREEVMNILAASGKNDLQDLTNTIEQRPLHES